MEEITFPNYSTIYTFVCDHKLLTIPYLLEKRVNKAIAFLLADRLQNKKLAKMGLEMQIILVIDDLQTGKDGYTNKPIPNYTKLELPSIVWSQISMSIRHILSELGK